MPVVDIDTDELRGLTGRTDTSDEEFKEDLFGLGLEFEGETDEDLLQFEFAPDRLDRLSVEGVARAALRHHYGDDRGVYVPETNDPEWTIEVDESVPDERPYVTGAVIRGVDLDGGARFADPAAGEAPRDDGARSREGCDRHPRPRDGQGAPLQGGRSRRSPTAASTLTECRSSRWTRTMS